MRTLGIVGKCGLLISWQLARDLNVDNKTWYIWKTVYRREKKWKFRTVINLVYTYFCHTSLFQFRLRSFGAPCKISNDLRILSKYDLSHIFHPISTS